MREAIEGSINTKTTKDLETRLDALIDDGVREIVLDFSQVPFIAYSGLRVLLKVGKKLKALGGSLKIVDPTPTVRERFRRLGFDKLFRIE